MGIMKVIHYRRRISSSEKICGRHIAVICIYIAYQQEGIQIYPLPFTHFLDGIFPESQADSQTGQDIEQLEIDIDKVSQLHLFRKHDTFDLCGHMIIICSKLIFFPQTHQINKRRSVTEGLSFKTI